MPRCTRNGCGKEFSKDTPSLCIHHSGTPVFHEGLKSWSCCSATNKPVLDFDEFMNIPGCMEVEGHTEAAPKVEPPKSAPTSAPPVKESTSSGKEVYTLSSSHAIPTPSPSPAATPEEEDDLDASVVSGTPCRRKGCGVLFVSDELNRIGDGDGTRCIYHPSPPIFREGSKGYLCCKRRVLEFDEFLKIQGCRTGRHCFVPRGNSTPADEMVTCRVDHYQTLDKVYVSIFAKQADKSKSAISFDDAKVSLDLLLPGSKRFKKELELFGPINPSQSSFHFLGTKVELQLKKQDNRSWPVLEKSDRSLGNLNFTFGVGGRTGTVGAKEIVLDKSRA